MGPIDLSPGSLFAGQFRIVRPLAKGGMGAVYVVEQVATGRERALKLMHPMLVSDAKSIERFQREAQVASRIESDHVVEVIAAGVEAAGPTPWLCMELLKGETLADRVEKRGVPGRQECVEIVKQLAHALGAAHRAGIVHRDLKPENIFLAESRRDGVPFTLKVLDFGVATLTNELQGPKTTQGVGSPLWMAPEQTNVGKVVLATDVWAMGLIAFFLLTGQSYWRTVRTPGSTITALLVEIMVEELVPASARAREVAPGAHLPPGFDEWFARCVVRDPAARFQDAAIAASPLLSILTSAHQTLPEALLATAAVPPMGSGTLPGALSHASGPQASVPSSDVGSSVGAHALAATQPGPQLASGPQVVAVPQWQGPGAYAPTPPGAPPLATLVSPRPRSVWPWVLLGALGVGGLCAMGVTYQLVQGGEQIAREIAATPLEGHFVDPESGATVDLGPEGLRVTGPSSAAGSEIQTATEADTETGAAEAEASTEGDAEANADGEAEVEADDEADAEGDAEREAEGDAEREAEGDAERGESEVEPAPSQRGPIAQIVAGMERRRDRREARTAGTAAGARAPHSTVTPAQLAAFESRVVRLCRTNLDGQPRTRFTVVIGGGIRVTPSFTEPQNWFARCVRINAGESHQPDGTYVFSAP